MGMAQADPTLSNTGVLCQLLPFIELGNVEDAINVAEPMALNPNATIANATCITSLAGNGNIMASDIENFLCPSDPGANTSSAFVIAGWGSGTPVATTTSTSETVGLTNYMPCIGGLLVHSSDRSLQVGGTNGVTASWVGALESIESGTIESMRDGSSNTMLIGESLGAVQVAGAVETDSAAVNTRWSWGFGGVAAALPAPDATRAFGESNNTTEYQFSSPHTGVVNFVFGDGSTHSVPNTVAPLIAAGLGAKSDRQVIGVNDF